MEFDKKDMTLETDTVNIKAKKSISLETDKYSLKSKEATFNIENKTTLKTNTFNISSDKKEEKLSSFKVSTKAYDITTSSYTLSGQTSKISGGNLLLDAPTFITKPSMAAGNMRATVGIVK